MSAETSAAAALPPGSTIGILGGGQLGRMLALAAAPLGYRCHIYAPGKRGPAAEVAESFTCAAYDDEAAMAEFSERCDVVTYEFENVPTGPLALVAERSALYPGANVLDIAQSRIAEKTFIRDLSGAIADCAFVERADDLADAIARVGCPAILKSNRLGYDGKGQARIAAPADAAPAWQAIGARPALLEGLVDFDAEFSVILVRGPDGEIRFWDSPRNVHEDGILRRSLLPAGRPVEDQVGEARALARKAVEALGHVGVLTFEFFATEAGPLFNEMAPRVHNSGHWTIEGAATSQFENHIRAICGLPLGDCTIRAPRVEMTNLIGAQADDAHAILTDPAAHLHLYGKGEARPGRKMGHATRLYFDR